jgi:hypothetical protein
MIGDYTLDHHLPSFRLSSRNLVKMASPQAIRFLTGFPVKLGMTAIDGRMADLELTHE